MLSFGIAPDIQQALKDLSFDGHTLFSDKIDETLQSFKDSRATILSLSLPSLKDGSTDIRSNNINNDMVSCSTGN